MICQCNCVQWRQWLACCVLYCFSSTWYMVDIQKIFAKWRINHLETNLLSTEKAYGLNKLRVALLFVGFVIVPYCDVTHPVSSKVRLSWLWMRNFSERYGPTMDVWPDSKNDVWRGERYPLELCWNVLFIRPVTILAGVEMCRWKHQVS